MHSTVVGYIMLLASFITFAFLLQRGCKHKKKSPFYVLSMSDVFSTILTAVALLALHSEAGIKLSYNRQNDTRDTTTNRTWMLEEEEDTYRFPFLQNYHLYRTANKDEDLNVTVTCDMNDILMQYGMLLGALTNAFVSVLTFAAQCNLNATHMKKTCSNVQREARQITQRGRRALKNELPSAFQHRNIDSNNSGGSYICRIMKIFTSTQTSRNNNKKSICFLVTSHWLVPFFVVGTLYIAEYDDTNIIRRTEDIECVFQSNFPTSDFYTFSETIDVNTMIDVDDSVTRITSVKNNSFVNEDLLTPTSIEIDEVVSKVQDIIRMALNHINHSTENTGRFKFFNSSTLQSLIELNNTLMTEQNVRNLTSNRNIYFSQEMFHDLLKNISENAFTKPGGVQASVKNKNHQEEAQIYFANADKSRTKRLINFFNRQRGTFISNNQTYNDIIMKHLQAASANAVKQRNNSADRVANRKQNLIRDLFFSKRDNLHQYFNTIMQNNSLHMTNKCFVSNNFLKLHLFVLFFAFYFLSILLSCVLQLRGKHTCRNTLALVNATTDPMSDRSKNVNSNEDDNRATIVSKSRSESRLSTNIQDKISCHEDLTEETNIPHETRDDHSSDSADVQINKEDFTKIQKNSIILEIDCIIRISNIVKLCLILCVILWTPIFLEILLKVLTCNHTPPWLTDVTFSSAFFFSVLRHAVNVNIIKIQEICGNTNENRIHPVNQQNTPSKST